MPSDLPPATDAPAGPASAPPFDTPCERCGTFAPLSTKYGPALCAECLERGVDPVQRDPFSVGSLLSGAFSLVRRVGLPSTGLLLVAAAPPAIAGQVVELPLYVSNLYDLFVLMPVEMVALVLAFQGVVGRAERPDVRAAFSRVGARYGALLGTRFLSGLVVLLFALLLVVPGIVRALSLALVMPICLFEGGDAGSAMKQSTERMRGHRLEILGAYVLAGIPFLLAVFVPACIVTTAMMQSPIGAFEPSPLERVVSFVVELFIPVLLLPVTFVQLVAYLKTAAAERA